MKAKIIALFIVILTVSTPVYAQKTTGPETGSLVIVGGGRMSDEIVNKFIELAGGPEAQIVVVPTATGADTVDQRITELFTKRGAKNITILHTKDPKVADTKDFVRPLKTADAVWFTGGRQWRIVDAYGGTKTETAFREVLTRGGVIGGSSAGATIQGSFLARGDTKNNQIMMGDHQRGFGYISNVAIDQHVLARNRQFDMFDILKKKPDLLGLAIDEGTAIVVKKNEFEVMGRSYVLVYDTTFWSREGIALKTLPEKEARFYLLRSGDRYDLLKREVVTRKQ